MSFRKIYRKPLGVITKTNSRNQTPGRRREKDLKPTPPSYPKLREESENKEPTFMINLEDVLIIEQNLYYIIETFHNIGEVTKTCEELWDLTTDNTLNQISSLYKDDKKRGIIRRCIVLQSVTIALSHYLFTHFKLNPELVNVFRTIFFYTHQGFLVFSKFILLRVPEDNENIWISKLSNLIETKSKKNINDLSKLLSHYNKSISSGLKKICRNFIFRCEDPVVNTLKIAVIQILRDLQIQPENARINIEKAFGITRDSVSSSFQQVKPPFLPALSVQRYTLVLDLDETLVHYIETEEKGQYLSRPYLENFLNDMKKIYEIVVFTAAVQDYADWILDDLDSKKIIDYRLYRQHTVPAGNYFLKDLSNLGRDLSKVVIIDNVAENFQLQQGNGILIKSWYNDASDTALKELTPILEQIVKSQMDVRVALKIFRDQMLDQLSRGIDAPSLCLNS